MIRKFAFIDLKKRPYELLGIMALLLFLVSFVPSTQSALDINLHDTYFVIAGVSICRIFSGVLLFLWAMNMVFRRQLWSIKLTWVQVILTAIPMIAFLKITILGAGVDGVPRRYYSFSEFEQQKPWFTATIVYVFMMLLFALGQLIFIINVIGGFLRKVSRTASSK